MRSHSRALFAIAALFAFLVLPSSAFAGKSVERLIETGGTAGGLALNRTSGELYVQIRSADRIERYDASTGAFLGEFGANGSGAGDFSFGGAVAGIAIDESDGSVYVADIGNDRIEKFEADGTFVAVIGDSGSGPGQLDLGPTTRIIPFEGISIAGGLGVDQDSGDLYVADTANNRIQRFSSAGVFEAELGVGQLQAPSELGVDETGRVFALDRSVNLPPLDYSEGNVFRFNSAGGPGTKLTGSSGALYYPATLGVDPALGHLYVRGYGTELIELDASGQQLDVHGKGAPALVGGIAPATASGASATGDLYGTTGTDDFVLVLTDAGAATASATIAPATSVGTDTATLNGSVNSNGDLATSWRFELSTNGTDWAPTSGGTVPGGIGDVQVSEAMTGLEVSTPYQVRLVATKAFGGSSATSGLESFTTGDVPPLVEAALPPGLLTDTSARLGARVNPRNSATTFYVEYSTATDPGFADSIRVPASEGASAGSGGSFITANLLVDLLQPDTTYHFRVVATNVAGTMVGDPRAFTTRAVPVDPPGTDLPNDRVYEKVSPNDKAGANIDRGAFSQWRTVAFAASNGDSVAFSALGPNFAGDSSPLSSQYIARRSADGGWDTEGVSPRNSLIPEFVTNTLSSRAWWMSPDLSFSLITTRAALNPGDPDDLVQNLYLRDNRTKTYQAINADVPDVDRFNPFLVQAATPDGKNIVFMKAIDVVSPFDEGALYEWSDGDLREVGVLPEPDGSSINAELTREFEDAPGENALSRDGNRVYFKPQGQEVVYLRDFTESPPVTKLVSASERTGDDPTLPVNGNFELASEDGSVAFFTAFGEPLTDESAPPYSMNLYRWDSTAPEGERLTDITTADPQGGGVLGTTASTADASKVYFVAEGKLTPDAIRGTPNLYLWSEDGEDVKLVASGVDADVWSDNVLYGESSFYRGARMSPDGRYIVFTSHAPLTSYDTAGTRQVYWYDSTTGQLRCVSCGLVEPRSSADSALSLAIADGIGGNWEPDPEQPMRNFSADGQRVVFDSWDALLPRDTNGTVDVYQWVDGKLDLISSGSDRSPSLLFGVSEDGADIFFTTQEALVRSDQDVLIDLYDARVGGRPEPVIDAPCVGDECQGNPSSAPRFDTPGSGSFEGTGNVSSRKRCSPRKIRRGQRCVPRKRHKSQRSRQNGNGRRH